jgi:trans-2,3-dihydro-3-hydroxyanthranilate isomerase
VSREASGGLTGAVIDAPRPLVLGPELTPEQVATCLGVAAGDVVTANHRPVQASVGVDFFFAEVAPGALSGAGPDLAGFRQVAADTDAGSDRLSIFVYARDGRAVRARMFAPLSGTFEDAATGSASATLGALLLSLTGDAERAYDITQGVEMGRPSRLDVTARRGADGIRASVGGGCVPVFTGTVSL